MRLIQSSKKNNLSKRVKLYNKIEELLKNTELLIIATPWKMLKKINLKKFKKIKYIIDPYRQLTPSRIHKLCSKYIVMGK